MGRDDNGWVWLLLILALPFLLLNAGHSGMDEVQRKRRISNWIGGLVLVLFAASVVVVQVSNMKSDPKPVPVQAKAEAKEPRLSEPKPVAEKKGWHFNFKWGGK